MSTKNRNTIILLLILSAIFNSNNGYAESVDKLLQECHDALRTITNQELYSLGSGRPINPPIDDAREEMIYRIVHGINSMSYAIERNVFIPRSLVATGSVDVELSQTKLIEEYNQKYHDAISICQRVATEIPSQPILNAIKDQQNKDEDFQYTTRYLAKPLWNWMRFKPQEIEYQGTDQQTYTVYAYVEKKSGSLSMKHIYPVLEKVLTPLRSAVNPEGKPPIGSASLRAEFDIDPLGKVDKSSYYSYPLNRSMSPYMDHIDSLLNELHFPESRDFRETHLQISLGVWRKQEKQDT